MDDIILQSLNELIKNIKEKKFHQKKQLKVLLRERKNQRL